MATAAFTIVRLDPGCFCKDANVAKPKRWHGKQLYPKAMVASSPRTVQASKDKARKDIRVAVLGASGYTGSEIIKLMANHPHFSITLMTADRKAGQSIGSVFPYLITQDLPDMVAIKDANFDDVEAVLCCLPRGTTQDFLLQDISEYEEWYGQPHRAPELQANLITFSNIIIDSKSGVSGAGCSPKEANLFPEVTEGIHAYGITRHRHVPEIEQELSDAAHSKVTVSFTPHLMPMSHGMLSTIYVEMVPGARVENLYNQLRDLL